MATPGAIARMRAEAHERMITAAAQVADKLGIVALDLPTQGRDPNIVMAQQTEALAGWLTQVAEALTAPAAPGAVPADLAPAPDAEPDAEPAPSRPAKKKG